MRIVKTFLYFLGGKFQENEYESRSLNVVEEHEVHDRTRSSYHRKFSLQRHPLSSVPSAISYCNISASSL